MARAPVSAVEVLSVPREEFPHDDGDPLPTAAKQQVNVVVHKHPCIYGAIGFKDILAEPFQECGFVLLVLEYFRSIDPPHHDMVQGSGHIESCLAWHGACIGVGWALVKRFAS